MKTLTKYLFINISSLLLIGLFLHGCSPSSTSITAQWTDEAAQAKTYDHIVVAPYIAGSGVKSAMEKELAGSLAARDVKVGLGSDFLPLDYTDKTEDKEEILESVKLSGADAILTVSLVDKESETRYIPSTYPYSPSSRYAYYGSFWGYYDYWYPKVYGPGYYDTEQLYYLETNVFDAETENLIWSTQTETSDPITIESFTDDFSKKIVKELKDDGII
ncbi:MAG: hypothetical protein RIA69_02230 [Cyclobacteriaceae bacterium]